MLRLLLLRRRGLPVLTVDNVRVRLYRTLLVFAVVVALHVVAMQVLEGLGLQEALWLTLTTATTVGYGDLSATTTAGQWATVVLLYGLGITLLANLAGYYIDYRTERKRKQLTGRWRWNMQAHIVIINAPYAGAELYFIRLVTQIRSWGNFSQRPILILTDRFPDGLPESLRELGVCHCHADPDSPEALDAVSVSEAARIIVLAEDEDSRRSDTLTAGVLDRLHTHGVSAPVVAECVVDDNRERLARFLPYVVLLRPVRSYPEILVRALVAPGTEQVLENLFTQDGDHPLRYDVAVDGDTWGNVLARLVAAGYGTPIAYVDADGGIVTNPAGHERCHARALFLLVRDDKAPNSEQVRRAIG